MKTLIALTFRLLEWVKESAPRSGFVEWRTDDGRAGRNFFKGLSRGEVDIFASGVCRIIPGSQRACVPVTITYRIVSRFDGRAVLRRGAGWGSGPANLQNAV